MKTFLGTVLSVIAAGVLLIAYGLLSPRAAAAPYGGVSDLRGDAYQLARPMPVNDMVSLNDQAAFDRYFAARRALGTGAYPVETVSNVRPVRATQTYSAPRRTSAASVERAPGRDWKKTALIIGGTTAAGAGVGAIFGGKKGALIGAAIGGGGSTIYEAMKK
jgi:hypothetical protein